MQSTVGEVYNLPLPAKPADGPEVKGDGSIPSIETVDRKGDHTTKEMPLVDPNAGLNDQYNPYTNTER